MEPISTLSEKEVWLSFQAGSEEAFSFLFHAHYNDLYRYALKIAGNESVAKDAIQELFITLWRSRQRLGAVTAVKPYLMKSLRRDLLRGVPKSRKVHAKLKAFRETNIVFSAEEITIRDESWAVRKQCLLQQLNHLSRRQREVVYLRYYDDLSYEEISQVMGLNYQSVLNHLHKAMKALRNDTVLQRLVEASLAVCLYLYSFSLSLL
jgi:RNA polymerase sigma factor (sigma-70 family)